LIFHKKTKKKKELDPSKLLFSFPSNSRYAESFRTLRTNLFFSGMDKEIRSILVTSALEREGKTNTVINLGHAIARTDRRVLLIDCDLRRPSLSNLVPKPHDRGVCELMVEVFGIHLTRGSLADYTVGDLILLARLQKRTALLDLENDTTRAALVFEKGRLTDMVWTNRPDDANLADALVRDNRITRQQAERAVSHQKKTGQRLDHVLQTLGLVSRKELSRALSEQAIDTIEQVSAMTDGTFAFSQPSEEPGKSASAAPVDLETLFDEFNTGDITYKYCQAAIESAVAPTEEDNLFVLPAGAVPANPAETVGSGRMAFLIDYLKNRFDFIIIDTPPVTPASDALVLAPRVDGTLFVIKSGHTNRKVIQDAVDQFQSANQPILGMVLNQVNMKKEGYYRYYQKYYASYYGR
jgi:capsular exopolysaccharide synthesis family protein